MNEFYTNLDGKVDLMFTTLLPITFVLLVFALWSNISNGSRSGTMYLRALVSAIVIVVVVSQISNWMDQGKEVVHSLVYDTLEADPGAVYEKYKSMTAASDDGAEEGGFWHTIFNLSEKQIFKNLITAMLWTIQWIAKFVVFIADVIYNIALAFALAASPIFIGFLAVRSLSHIGFRFMLTTVGILMWPLGWGFASLVTDTLLEMMAQDSFVSATGMEELKNLLAVAVAGLWMIFSTIAAPLVIKSMITEGINAGTALIAGGWSAARSGVHNAASSGATLAASGAASPVALAGAAGAGALAFGSASMPGSGGSSGMSGLVRNAVDWGKPPKSSQSYDAKDPANDKKAVSLVSQSRNPKRKSS